MLVLLVLAFGHGSGPASRFDFSPGVVFHGASVQLLLTALVPILFAYGGWQSCANIAGEIKNPVRNPPRANVLGVIVVIVLYLSLNVAYLWVLTPAQVAASPTLAADTVRAVAGEAGARFVAALIVVSSLGFLAVVILTGPRLYYAMAADGLLFERAGRIHPKYQTPVFALWFQAAVSLALLTTNTYDQLLSYVVFADWLFLRLDGRCADHRSTPRRLGRPTPPRLRRSADHPPRKLRRSAGAFAKAEAKRREGRRPGRRARGRAKASDCVCAGASHHDLVKGRVPRIARHLAGFILVCELD
jgi:hypothetical protein